MTRVPVTFRRFYVGCAVVLLSMGFLLEPERPAHAIVAPVAILFGCGGGGADPPHPSSPGVVTLLDIDPSSFNAVNGGDITARFSLANASFQSDPESVKVFMDGEPQDSSFNNLTVAPQLVTVRIFPYDGRTHLHLQALDSQDLPIDAEFVFWTGSRTAHVNVSDDQGNPLAGLTVTTTLNEDERIESQAVTDALGDAVVSGLPQSYGMTYSAHGPSGEFDSASGRLSANLALRGFERRSNRDNNDFNLHTTDGWETGSSEVAVGYHREEVNGPSDPDNWDMAIYTDATYEPQRVSRTFQMESGSKEVTARYRFVTCNEFNRGQPHLFNDWYSVALRSEATGDAVHETNSVWGLGEAMFEQIAGGIGPGCTSTQWRELRLQTDPNDDVIQADFAVSNDGDNTCDATLMIDFIGESPITVDASLMDYNRVAASYSELDTFLSGAPGPTGIYDGNVLIWGTLSVEGEADDTLESLEIDVIEDGRVVATGDVSWTVLDGSGSPAPGPTLFEEFGTDERVEITADTQLFQIPPTETSNIVTRRSGFVDLEVRAKVLRGAESTHKITGLIPLDRYGNRAGETNRYGFSRDGGEGGDSWAHAQVVDAIAHFSTLVSDFTVNDFSNMHGGDFAGHVSHETGLDVDFRITGVYDAATAPGAAAAGKIISMLNDTEFGPYVESVGVTYSRTDGDPFHDAIKNVTLNSGEAATARIRRWSGHRDHGHLRFFVDR